jgi:hypothetical protein
LGLSAVAPTKSDKSDKMTKYLIARFFALSKTSLKNRPDPFFPFLAFWSHKIIGQDDIEGMTLNRLAP